MLSSDLTALMLVIDKHRQELYIDLLGVFFSVVTEKELIVPGENLPASWLSHDKSLVHKFGAILFRLIKCIKQQSVDELLKHFIEAHDIRSTNKSNDCQMSSSSPKNRIFFNSLSPINNHNHRIIIPKQEYISKAVAISKPITVTTRPPPNHLQPIGTESQPPLSPPSSPMDRVSSDVLPMDLTNISIREAPGPTKKSFSCLECGLVYSKRQATTDMLQIHDKLCDQWRSIWMQNGNIKVRTLSA